MNSSYSPLDDWKQRYLLYAQTDFERSTGKSISIRSVNSQVYSTMVLKCKLSLGFQKKDVLNLCAGTGCTVTAATNELA